MTDPALAPAPGQPAAPGYLTQYEPAIQGAAKEWNVDPTVLKALIMQESSANAGAVSSAGAYGLTGIMPQTAKDLGITDPTDPTQQIFGGAKYLSQGYAKEGSTEGALLYYHGGPDWRKNYGSESQGYVPAVAARFKALGGGAAAPDAGQQGLAPAAPPAPVPPAATPAATTPPAPGAAPGAVPSDADFLSMTGAAGGRAAPAVPVAAPVPGAAPGATAPGAVPSDADFLKMTGAAPAEPATAPASSMGPAPLAPANALARAQSPTSTGANVLSSAGNVLSAAGQGAASGFGPEAVGLSPETRGAFQKLGIFPPANGNGTILQGVNQTVMEPLGALVNLGVRGGSALLGAGQAAVAQTGAEVGQPQLGRDLAAFPEAFPTGDMHGGTTIPVPSGAAPAAATARTNALAAAADTHTAALQAPLSGAFRDNPLSPALADRLAAPTVSPTLAPGAVPNSLALGADGKPIAAAPPPAAASPTGATGQPQVATAPPGPQSLGAAASRDMSDPATIGMSPKLINQYRSTAEGQKLLEPQPRGADFNAYVPGVNPNQAELEQSANTSRELAAIGNKSTVVSDEMKAAAAANSSARQHFFAERAGSPVTLGNALDVREAQGEADLAAAWANKSAADPQPLLDTANQILASPDGRRPLVRDRVNSVVKEMYDANGQAITDPEQLYGVRKHIDDLISPEAQATDQLSKRVLANLLKLKDSLTDNVITPAAPGFDQYLTNFKANSVLPDTMTVLQGYETKLYNNLNQMMYNPVQRMMRDIVDARSGPGINPAKSIPDETMTQLWNLRDDLRRSASAQELARTNGSNTAQNLWDMAKNAGDMATTGVTLGVANWIAPGLGSVVVGAVKNAAAPILASRTARKATNRGINMLHPNPARYPPTNLLSPD